MPRWPGFSKALSSSRAWAAAGLAALALWGGGLLWYGATIPLAPTTDQSSADAVVVLTGGSERLVAGLALLHQGLGKKLFVSGVYRGLDVTELLRVARQTPEEADCCIVLGHEAADTRGNATETAAWMEQQHFHSLRLVTANYHMRRALLEFRASMPDIAITPNPVFPALLHDPSWWTRPDALRIVVSEYDKYLAASALYGLTGVTPQGMKR